MLAAARPRGLRSGGGKEGRWWRRRRGSRRAPAAAAGPGLRTRGSGASRPFPVLPGAPEIQAAGTGVGGGGGRTRGTAAGLCARGRRPAAPRPACGPSQMVRGVCPASPSLHGCLTERSARRWPAFFQATRCKQTLPRRCCSEPVAPRAFGVPACQPHATHTIPPSSVRAYVTCARLPRRSLPVVRSLFNVIGCETAMM